MRRMTFLGEVNEKFYDLVSEINYFLFESKHALENLAPIEKDIVVLISQFYQEMCTNRFLRDWGTGVYTDWNFISNQYKDKLKDNGFVGDLFPFMKCQSEKVGHPIYIRFINTLGIEDYDYMETDFKKQSFGTKKDFEDAFKIEYEFEKIFIIVHFNRYLINVFKNNDVFGLYDFCSIVSHELLHIASQFFNEYAKPYQYGKYGLNTSFIKDSFGIDRSTNLYRKVYDLTYLLSKEEREARIQAQDSMLKYISTQKDYIEDTLYFELYNARDENKFFRYTPSNKDDLKAVVLMKDPNVKQTTYIDTFSIKIEELYKEYNKKVTEEILLLVGYYMHKHNMLDYNEHKLGIKVKNYTLRKFFERENIEQYLINNDVILGKKNHILFEDLIPAIKKIVLYSIESVFNDYLNKAKSNAKKYIDVIFSDIDVSKIDLSENWVPWRMTEFEEKLVESHYNYDLMSIQDVLPKKIIIRSLVKHC